jgi:hypothetical protein
MEMKRNSNPAVMIIVVSLVVLGRIALAAQDRFTLKAPNGVAVSKFRRYDDWQPVAVSETGERLKVTTLIPTYNEEHRLLRHDGDAATDPGLPIAGSACRQAAALIQSRSAGPAAHECAAGHRRGGSE